MTSTARADSPCELRFESASIPDAWADVVRDVRTLVAKLTPATTDCRTITVIPEEDGATVVFTTADGRVARRRIADPRELRPTVEALLVFGPEPSISPSDARPAPLPVSAVEPERESTEPPAPFDPPAKDAAKLDAKRDVLRPLVGAGAGVKGSFPRDTVSGVGQIFAGMSLEHWELAAFGRWELEHDAPPEASTGHDRFSSIGGGAMFGRREKLGPLVLIAGARAAVFNAEVERHGAHDEAHTGRVDRDFLDPRVGLYVGCILAESSRVRFRTQVDGDAGVLAHRTELAELPTLPRWNLGVSIGAETSFLP
jgi:hypothetical protein